MLTLQTLEGKRWYTDASVGIRGADGKSDVGIPPIWVSFGIFAAALGFVWWQAKQPANKRRF